MSGLSQAGVRNPAGVSIAESRREHAESLLKTNRDLWLATSSGSGPHLVPLSFVWHSERLLFATSAASRTGRNLLENGLARAAIGGTRDLVIVVGSVSPADADDKELPRMFAYRNGRWASASNRSGICAGKRLSNQPFTSCRLARPAPVS